MVKKSSFCGLFDHKIQKVSNNRLRRFICDTNETPIIRTHCPSTLIHPKE